MSNKATKKSLPILNVTVKSDYHELRKAYQFIPDQPQPQSQSQQCHSVEEQDQIANAAAAKLKPSTGSSNRATITSSDSTTTDTTTATVTTTTWQERMVQKYHSHLYKSHVIADFSKQTKTNPNNIGLRWRVKDEVVNGKGFDTCGNKHCPCYYQDYYDDNETDDLSRQRHQEVSGVAGMDQTKKRSKKRKLDDIIRWKANKQNRSLLDHYEKQQSKENEGGGEEEMNRLLNVPFGLGLFDYTVHFKYKEQDQVKQELVQLKLCLRCAPKLFQEKGDVLGAWNARRKVEQNHHESIRDDDNSNNNNNKHTSDEARKRKGHTNDRREKKSKSKKKKCRNSR